MAVTNSKTAVQKKCSSLKLFLDLEYISSTFKRTKRMTEWYENQFDEKKLLQTMRLMLQKSVQQKGSILDTNSRERSPLKLAVYILDLCDTHDLEWHITDLFCYYSHLPVSLVAANNKDFSVMGPN